MTWVAYALVFGGALFWGAVGGAVGWLLVNGAIHAVNTTIFMVRVHRTGKIHKSWWFRHHLRLWAHFFLSPCDRAEFTTGGVAYWPGREKAFEHEDA